MAATQAAAGSIHPGAYVRRHVLPEGITVTKAAALLNVGRPALSNFLNGKASLSQEMARRLARAFGADSETLLDLQAQYDRREEAVRAPIVAGRHAPTLVAIEARRIEGWADTTRAREELPALLRRLVHTTGGGLACVDFPAFDNSQRPGWDGEVETTTPTPWIPDGRSGWEFGCDRRPGRKADSDYAKRVAAVPPGERRNITFVFATPRNWPGKATWAAAKAASGEWKCVRAYDASDLEQWLEQSAPAQVWFAERLDIPVDGWRSLDRCWSGWADACDPALSPALFDAAVREFSNTFRGWLDKPPERPFVVAADSRDEALAFLCCLVCEAESGTDEPGTGALVFDTPGAMHRFRAANAAPRIAIVHRAETEREIGDLRRRCHCVAVRPRNDPGSEPDIELGPPGWNDFSDALKSMKLSDHRIDRLSRESGRSPTVLRRRLSAIPAVRTPVWAADVETARRLRPTALAGAWCDASPADHAVIRQLARTENDSIVENDLAELLAFDDPPVWSTGQYRGVVSRIDALFGVAGFVAGPDLDGFFAVAESVLSEPDPALELPETERWFAAVRGKVRKYSATLRRSIRETLVLLAVHGDTLFRSRLDVDLQARVSSLVRRLLSPLTTERLFLHQDDLPDYAEAAPDTFLSLIEADLRTPEPAVFGLLTPVGNRPFDRCPRTGLLWALECLGWTHLGRVSQVLAQMSRVAIVDNTANKPVESLAALYRWWLPRTSATPAERMRSLETLTKRFPDVGWQICIAQLNAGHQMAFPSYRPRWRDDAQGDRGVTHDQCHEFRRKALDLSLAWPNHDERTLGDFVEILHNLPEEARAEVWCLIDAWADSGADDDAKASLRERIRRFAFTRRGRRRIRGEGGDRARAAYDRLEPCDLVMRHSWLFTGSWIEHSADELDDEGFDHRKHSENIGRLRAGAAKELWATRGFEGVTALLSVSGAPSAVGEALESSIRDGTARVDFLRACLAVSGELGEKVEWCMHGFLWPIDDDARGTLLSTVAAAADVDAIVRLYRCAPFGRHTWRLLDSHGEEIRERYWQTVVPLWGRHDEAETTVMIDCLVSAKRPRAAFQAAHSNWSRVETSRLKRLLLEVATVDSEPLELSPLEAHDISNAIHELDLRDTVGRDEMARLEFMYIRWLDGSEHGIPHLERRISESPIDFVHVLALLFERDDNGQDPPDWRPERDEEQSALASAAYALLERIDRLPGTGTEGEGDAEALSQWVAEARRLCAEHGRGEIGDSYIGRILARAPAGGDGTRPSRVVSEAMERVGSSEIGQGFVTGIYNGRGVVSRAIGEGGGQERELAEKYRCWARKRSPDYPYVGSILERIADIYDREALREDDRAQVQGRLEN